MTYIIIYITTSSTLPTSSNRSTLTSLTTSSSSFTKKTTSQNISYRWSTSRERLQNCKMSFTQELTCRWSTSTWTPTRLLQGHLHRNCYTGFATGVQLTSRWSNCTWTPAKIRLLQFFYFSLAAGPGGGLRTVTLCGVSDTQTCAEMRVLFVLGQPSVEIAHVGWANMWCGERRNFFARSNRLRRSCVSEAQTCGGMWISFGHGQPSAEIAPVGHPNMWQNANLVRPVAAPSHEMRVNRQKLVWYCDWKSRCKRGTKVKWR